MMTKNFYDDNEEKECEDCIDGEETDEEISTLEEQVFCPCSVENPLEGWPETSGMCIPITSPDALQPTGKLSYTNGITIYPINGIARITNPETKDSTDKIWLTAEVWKKYLGIDDVDAVYKKKLENQGVTVGGNKVNSSNIFKMRF